MIHEKSKNADLDVLPEVPEALVVVLVCGPFRTIDGHLAELLEWICRYFGKMLDFIDVFLANLFALSAVVDIEAYDRGRDGEKDEPVSGRHFGAFVEP